LDSSNNIYIAGWTESYGLSNFDICLLKYNSTGTLQWNYTWGGTGEDVAYAIGLDSSENIYLTGWTASFGAVNFDICLLKYNSTGVLQWNYTWGGTGGDFAYGLAIDLSDNIYVAGETSSFGASGSDVCLLKYNSTGALQWNYTWGGTGGDYAYELAIDLSDNIYLTGATGSFGALDYDVFLLKYNSTGALQWNYTWGEPGLDIAYAIGLDSSNNIYLGGCTKRLGASDYDVCLLKYNSTGALQWNYTWGEEDYDYCYAIGLDSSDNIYLAGSKGKWGTAGKDMYLLRYNPTGVLQGNYIWSRKGEDEACAIGLDSSENIYLAGWTTGFGAIDTDMCLVKLDNSPPLITINSPIQDIFIGNVAPYFNISIIEPLLNTTWYTLDDGTTNIIFSGLTGTIKQTEWDKKGDGPVTIRFCANDTAGKEKYVEVTVRKDASAPTSSISYVLHGDPNIVNDSTIFTISADDGQGSGVAATKYKIKYGTTYDSGWIDYTIPFDLSSYNSGDYLISYYSTDTIGNIEDETTIPVELIRLSSEPPAIPGYHILLLISIIGVASVILLKFKYKFSKF